MRELARVEGVERWVWLVGGGLAHCWVLKHQGREAGVWRLPGLVAWTVGSGSAPLGGGWLLSFVSCARLGVRGVGGVVV